jgi:hypothetical protein
MGAQLFHTDGRTDGQSHGEAKSRLSQFWERTKNYKVLRLEGHCKGGTV